MADVDADRWERLKRADVDERQVGLDLIRKRLEREDQRYDVIDRKSAMLLVAAGLVASLATSSLDKRLSTFLAVLLAGTLLCCLGTCLCAIAALRVRKDAPELSTEIILGSGLGESSEHGRKYMRQLICAIADVVDHKIEHNRTRSAWTRCAQWSFAVAVTLLTVAGIAGNLMPKELPHGEVQRTHVIREHVEREVIDVVREHPNHGDERSGDADHE